MNDLKIGVSGGGVLHTDQDSPSVDTIFRMVKDSGAFDYIERSPPPLQLDEFRAAVQKHGIPLATGSFFYTLGRDEPLMEWHLRIAREFGGTRVNMQIRVLDADGVRVTNERLADTYLWISGIGETLGVMPCFEIHVNMWSERFTRVAEVGDLVEARGGQFNITFDHSHVIFKIGNEGELDVENNRDDIKAGRLELDPYKPGNISDLWINRNWVSHAHARSAVPNNPVNIWAKHPDGSFGRGIQYPFIRPAAGQWHAPWDESLLEPWKEVLRRMMRHKVAHAESRLTHVTVEMIPGIDYGAGAKYSIFENAVAIATWLRQTWKEISR